MKTQIENARRAIAGAGLVSINPPPGFIDRCVPALCRAIKAGKAADAAKPETVAELSARCRGAAVALNLYAPARCLDEGQRAEIRKLAARLHEAGNALDGGAGVIVAA